MPHIPKPPDSLTKGAVDLDKVREELAKDKAERFEREQRALENAVRAWQRGMKRTFKGICGGSSLNRRFFHRAALKKMEREDG